MSAFSDELVPDIDLGDEHYLVFSRWAPDDLPENRAWLDIPEGEPLPVVEKWGAIIRHHCPGGQPCDGYITFDGDWQRRVHALNAARARQLGEPVVPYVVWRVASREPLTVTPSILCKNQIRTEAGRPPRVCNDHGFIRDNKWVRA